MHLPEYLKMTYLLKSIIKFNTAASNERIYLKHNVLQLWKPKIVMMPTLSALVAPKVFLTTILGFQWRYEATSQKYY